MLKAIGVLEGIGEIWSLSLLAEFIGAGRLLEIGELFGQVVSGHASSDVLEITYQVDHNVQGGYQVISATKGVLELRVLAPEEGVAINLF